MSVRFEVHGTIDGNAGGVSWGDVEGLQGDDFAVARVQANVDLGFEEEHPGRPSFTPSLRTPERAFQTVVWSFDQDGEPPIIRPLRGDLPTVEWEQKAGRVY